MKQKFLDIIKQKGIEKFDLFVVKSQSFPVEFEQNELNLLEHKNQLKIGLRIFKDGRVGGSSTNDFSTFEEMVDYALESVKFGKEIDYPLPVPEEFPSLPIYNDVIWDERVWINKGKEIIAKIENVSKEVKIDLSFNKTVLDVELVNSEGLNARYKRTAYTFFISGFAVLDSGFVFVYDAKSSTSLFKDIDSSVEHILENLKRANEIAKIKSGKFPVLFSPIALRTLLGSIQAGLNGDTVRRKASPMTGKLGEKLFSEKLTVLDNPYDPELISSTPFDDEGVKTRINTFIDKGVLKGYLHSLETAYLLNMEPTGNGQRAGNVDTVYPGFHNLVVKGGDETLEDMIEEIDYGLYVMHLIGGGQTNILQGEYSGNVGLGFLIENGEIKGRVKDTMIYGNVYQDFKNIVAVSKETKKLMNYELPYILIDGVSITTK